MRKIRHRRLMNLLMKENNRNYAKVAKWLQGSKTYGDGTYNYEFKKKCKCCGSVLT